MKTLLTEAQIAKSIIASLSDSLRNEVLNAMAKALRTNKDDILEANKLDLQNATSPKSTDKANTTQITPLSKPMLERLKLDSKKIDLMAVSLEEIASLKSPIGKITEGWENYNGLKIQKISVPLGVIAIIYESRPNVTSDTAGLCFKSGNICILKGGKEALHSNKAILKVLHNVLESFSLPKSAICFIDSREETKSLLKEDKFIDLVIPRGGEGLINFVVKNSTIPVIKHDKGVCHLYLHKDAPKDMAFQIALNAKKYKPQVCNSIETLLVHKDFVATKDLIEVLKENEIKILTCEKIANKFSALNLEVLKEEDFYNEYGDNILNIALVDSLRDAILHINKFGSHHSDSIITEDYSTAQTFLNEVDSACVYVNASTRFSDGGEFGFGAEVGISTSKIHARGPMGIDSLTTYKYQIYGNGQIRKS